MTEEILKLDPLLSQRDGGIESGGSKDLSGRTQRDPVPSQSIAQEPRTSSEIRYAQSQTSLSPSDISWGLVPKV